MADESTLIKKEMYEVSERETQVCLFLPSYVS